MKIFLGWSDIQSLAIAKVLKDWLPRVIQTAEIFYFVDIDKYVDPPKATAWPNALKYALEEMHFYIICLTRENCKDPWIHFEAGALFNTEGAKEIWTFLYGLEPTEVPFPLNIFQYASAKSRADVFKMVASMNYELGGIGQTPLETDILHRIFLKNWPDLENDLIGLGQLE